MVDNLDVFEAEPDGLIQSEPESADAPPLAADTFAMPVVMVESDVCHRKMCYCCLLMCFQKTIKKTGDTVKHLQRNKIGPAAVTPADPTPLLEN